MSGVSGGRGSRRADYKTNAHYCTVRQEPHPPSAGSVGRQWLLEGSCFERLGAPDEFVAAVSGGRGSRRADYKTSAHYCTVRQEPHPPSADSVGRQWPPDGSCFERLFAADDFVAAVSGGRGSRRADYKTSAHYCTVRQEPHPPSADSVGRQWLLDGSCFERLGAPDEFVSGVSGGRGSRRADYKTNARYCTVRQEPHPPSAGSVGRQWLLEGSRLERFFAPDDFVSGVSGGRGSRRADYKTSEHYCPVRQEPHPPSAGSESRQWLLEGSRLERFFAPDDFVSGVSGGRGSRRADYKTSEHYCPVRQEPHPPSAGSESRQWLLVCRECTRKGDVTPPSYGGMTGVRIWLAKNLSANMNANIPRNASQIR